MNFVSETDIAEQRKARQEEWERVRKADDPKEAPEVEYDSRCLFDQLQEQKDKKQEEFDEKIKFKNQFRGIDDGEADFLTNMANRANQLEKKKRLEEEEEIAKLKNNVVVSAVPEHTVKKKNEELNQALQVKNKSKKSQYDLLKNAIKRKSTTSSKVTDTESPSSKVPKVKAESVEGCSKSETNEAKDVDKKKASDDENIVIYPTGLKCVGVLPGIGTYYDSDDSSFHTSDEEIVC